MEDLEPPQDLRWGSDPRPCRSAGGRGRPARRIDTSAAPGPSAACRSVGVGVGMLARLLQRYKICAPFYMLTCVGCTQVKNVHDVVEIRWKEICIILWK